MHAVEVELVTIFLSHVYLNGKARGSYRSARMNSETSPLVRGCESSDVGDLISLRSSDRQSGRESVSEGRSFSGSSSESTSTRDPLKRLAIW